MKKTYRIKTNNQELFIRKQNESDATSRWIEFQKTRPLKWRIMKLHLIEIFFYYQFTLIYNYFYVSNLLDLNLNARNPYVSIFCEVFYLELFNNLLPEDSSRKSRIYLSCEPFYLQFTSFFNLSCFFFIHFH